MASQSVDLGSRDASAASVAALAAAIALKADKLYTIVADATTARTLGSTDNGKLIAFSNAGAIVITVPGTLPVGSIFSIAVLNGAGQATFAGSGGLTVYPPKDFALKSRIGGTGIARLTVEIISATVAALSGDVSVS